MGTSRRDRDRSRNLRLVEAEGSHPRPRLARVRAPGRGTRRSVARAQVGFARGLRGHRRHVTIESGHERELLLWSDPSGSEALLIGDVPGTQGPDQRAAGEDDPPSTLFELALDAYDGAADWGLLLAGTRVRVYRRSSGISQQYVELDLETVVDLDDELTWRTFAAIFRAPGLCPGRGGRAAHPARRRREPTPRLASGH